MFPFNAVGDSSPEPGPDASAAEAAEIAAPAVECPRVARADTERSESLPAPRLYSLSSAAMGTNDDDDDDDKADDEEDDMDADDDDADDDDVPENVSKMDAV
jgi:hypothetical protein